jgi:hypothetical protein
MDLSKLRILKRLRNLEAELAILRGGSIADETSTEVASSPTRLVLVVAHDLAEFDNWRRSYGFTQKEARFISSPEHLYGYDVGTRVVFIGRWNKRRDAADLWDIAQHRYDVSELEIFE